MYVPMMNAHEVYEIGINIEKNGRSFYQAALSAVREPQLRALLNELVQWEDRHVALFEELRAALPIRQGQSQTWDADEETSRYLRAAAGAHVFVAEKDAVKLVSRCTTPHDILRLAIAFEKDSVVYYTAVQKAVPEHLGRDRIGRLIDEEMSHIAMLSERLQQGA